MATKKQTLTKCHGAKNYTHQEFQLGKFPRNDPWIKRNDMKVSRIFIEMQQKILWCYANDSIAYYEGESYCNYDLDSKRLPP